MSPHVGKLILGTAQFGLEYGISNRAGKTPSHEVGEILRVCLEAGLTTLDTADAYGDSQEVLAQNDLRQFQVISKFSLSDEDRSIASHLKKTLARLGRDSLHAYLYHRFADCLEQDQTVIKALKASGLIGDFGVSIYSDEELKKAISMPWIDIIQIPFNLLDGLPARAELFLQANKNSKKIHIRSVFLQGLLLMDPETLPERVARLRPYLMQIRNLARSNGMSLTELCFGYALAQENVDGVVFAVENAGQLREHLTTIKNLQLNPEVYNQLPRIAEADRPFLNPANWKK